MAKAAKPLLLLLLLLALILCSLCSTMALKGRFSTEDELFAKPLPQFRSVQTTIAPEMRNSRRLMIGSTAPICTYNECRGCKYKCRAEQVPVEGNDPINSAYHYRCVCHR
ncbi:EPIDERMAL PATTERNING FACTOR-like protein 9, partial [Cucurbita argyrosperma subsp. sororia]